MLISLSKRATALELIDGHVESVTQLEGSFRDIALANRFFGGTAAARYAFRDVPARTVLDVATGIADIPASLARDARKRGKDLRILCSDNNEQLVRYARERYGGDSRLSFIVADGKRLQFADGAFDVAMCNLALHHFDPPVAVEMLRELRRVSRLTPIVTDLLRSPLSYASTLIFTRLFSRNPLTRHDGPLSARRAYTLDEAQALALAAGWRAPKARAFTFIRMVLRDE